VQGRKEKVEWLQLQEKEQEKEEVTDMPVSGLIGISNMTRNILIM